MVENQFELGMGLFSTSNTSLFDAYVDDLLLNKIEYLRVDIPNYQDAVNLAQSKAAVIRAIAKGAKVIWGVSSNVYDNQAYAITIAKWPTFRAAILSAAQWAQDNGVYEFQIGNEEESHIGYMCEAGTMVRVSNVVTVTTPVAHGFDGEHDIYIGNSGVESMDGTFSITVDNATTFHYTAAGDDGANTATADVGDLDVGDLRALLKSVFTEAQTVFTNGKISYTCADFTIDDWVAAGKGDVDILASNIYRGTSVATTWRTRIDALVAGFGAENTYLTEFSLNSTSLDTYSTDEEVQATAISEMLDYIKAAGITRAHYFYYLGNSFGALKANGVRRKLWDVLKITNDWKRRKTASQKEIRGLSHG